MSKIEEMENSTYFLRQHSGWLIDEELGDVEYGIKVRREAFVKGAKAILEEIEKFIAELPCKSDGELLNQKMLWQRVKQLKEK